MKKNSKLLMLLLLVLMIFSSCGGNGGNYYPNNNEAISDTDFIKLAEDEDYTIYYQNANTYTCFYEVLFGVNSNEEFLVQYDYTVSYRAERSFDVDLVDKAYSAIKTSLDEIKTHYEEPSLFILKDGEVVEKELSVSNPNKENIEIVVLEYYVNFAVLFKDRYTVSHFMVPMKSVELKKIDDQIINFDGQKEGFEEFLAKYQIKER